MSLLLLFGGGDTSVPSILPLTPHTFRSSRRYKAERVIVLEQKDPNDVADYEINWTYLLGDDEISVSAWHIPTGVAGASGTNTSTTATIFVSGGTDGVDYTLTNRITTTDGRVFERSMVLPVRNL